MARWTIGVLAVGLIARTTAAQRPTLANAVRPFVAVDTNAVALTHVRVIDGTGAAPTRPTRRSSSATAAFHDR